MMARLSYALLLLALTASVSAQSTSADCFTTGACQTQGASCNANANCKASLECAAKATTLQAQMACMSTAAGTACENDPTCKALNTAAMECGMTKCMSAPAGSDGSQYGFPGSPSNTCSYCGQFGGGDSSGDSSGDSTGDSSGESGFCEKDTNTCIGGYGCCKGKVTAQEATKYCTEAAHPCMSSTSCDSTCQTFMKCIVSDSYGFGWSTWNSSINSLTMECGSTGSVPTSAKGTWTAVQLCIAHYSWETTKATCPAPAPVANTGNSDSNSNSGSGSWFQSDDESVTNSNNKPSSLSIGALVGGGVACVAIVGVVAFKRGQASAAASRSAAAAQLQAAAQPQV